MPASDDIVADLNSWLAHNHSDIIRRARDTIAELREALHTTQLLIAQHTRNDALVEASRACAALSEATTVRAGEDNWRGGCLACERAIDGMRDA